MHVFVIGSTFVITYLITYNCLRRCLGRNELNNEDVTMDEIYQYNPFSHYISKTELLQFFSEEPNFFKLKKVLDLDNGIFDKTLKLVENHSEISIDYEINQSYYGEKYFNHTYQVPTIMEIGDCKFKTSWGQLNYIRWLINNDYFLHIE